MDSHLVPVPGLGTLTTGRLPGGVLEDLGGESDGAPDVEVSVLGTVDEVGTELLKRLDVLGGQGDPDLVDLLGTGASLFEVFLVLGHF